MNLTAHAYVISGTAATIASVLTVLENEGIRTRGNPDVLVRAYDTFLMDDARMLRERANLRGTTDAGRIFVIAAPTIAPDAQNALLKTFEEPPAGARFFLVVPSPDMLLPTLRSRMQVLMVQTPSAVKQLVDEVAFLKAAPEKRLELLKPLLDKNDDDKRDLSGALIFLGALEKRLSEKPREHASGIAAVYRARKYMTDRGALTKALLEQCALLIPKVI